MNKTYVMDFNDFPVKQDCDGEDINRQNDQTSEIEKHTSRHSDNDSCAEALQTKSMNTSRRKNRPPGLHDGPHQRVYHQNELLRIGAAFGAAGLRRTHTGREDPSGFSSSGSRPLRRSTSIYNGISQDASTNGGDGSISRDSIHEDFRNAPSRQPINPDADFDWQKARGFAKFIRQHASPRYHRVTAGGRIVPAIPNTPPPTFHDAFLNAFLSNNEFQETQKHQVSGTFHQPYQNDTSGYDYSSSGYQLAHQGHNIYLHPHLKIPQGFRVVQASIDGTIAIIIRGTTIYRCELMSDGQTSCKIAAQGAMLSTSQSRGHPLDNRVFELESNRSYHGTANHYTPTMYVDGSGILPTAYSLPGYRYHQQESPTPQQPSWQEIEIQSQRDQHTRMERESSSHLDWRPAYSIQSPPGLNTGSYQQQLANLNETLQSLTTMLMDAERVLCFPKVLGQSGVEATVMKKQVILVKIEELSRKRQQIEEQFAYYNPGITARFSPESRYPGSSRTNTEIGNSGHEEFTYQNQYPGDTTPEARMLSPLAPAFIPKDQTTATKSLSNSETSCEGAITRMQSSSDFKHSQQDGSIELLKSPKTVVLTENKSTNPPPKNNFNPNRRSISHVFGSIPPDTTWARLPGETFEAFHTRYLKQRERVIGSRLASKLFIPSLSISPRKSMPELQRVHVTSRVSSMETIDETQKKVCI